MCPSFYSNRIDKEVVYNALKELWVGVSTEGDRESDMKD